jgi:hypothetical protein
MNILRNQRLFWRALYFALLSVVVTNNFAMAAEDNCFKGTREDARADAQRRLGYLCQLFCSGCGCKGGPGFRKQDGKCATTPDLARGACGDGPSYDRCKRECTPLHQGCTRGALPAADAPPIRVDEGLTLFEVTGEDKQGKRAAFDIILISEGLTWGYAGTEVLSGTSPVSGRDLRIFFKSRFAGVADIIASGTASSEGDRKTEENRARNRGAKLAQMAAETAAPETKLWVLNLGQYLTPCKSCSKQQTASQRPVFITGVIYKETPDVNIDEALHMALGRRNELPNPEQYSLFELFRFQE